MSGKENSGIEIIEQGLIKHADVAYRICLRITTNETDASDAFQNGCLNLIRRAGLYRSGTSMKAWICGTMRWAALDMIKQRKNYSDVLQGLALNYEEQKSKQSGNAINKRLNEVRKIIGSLPEKDRTALQLRYFESLNEEEVGQVLNCRGNTAGRRIRRALEKIRNKIGKGITLAVLLSFISEIAKSESNLALPKPLREWTASMFISPPVRPMSGSELFREKCKEGALKMLKSKMMYVAIVGFCAAICFTTMTRGADGQEAKNVGLNNTPPMSTDMASNRNSEPVFYAKTDGTKNNPEAETIDNDDSATEKAAGNTNPATDEEKKKQTEGNNSFAINMYEKLAAKENGNLFFSPYSIRTALAMTYAGAKGNTAKEMRTALNLNLPDNRLGPAFNAIRERIDNQGEGSHTLKIANALWGEKTYRFLKPFIETNKNFYKAGLQALDFKNKPEESRKAINLWVENRTEKKIINLIPHGSINEDTRLVLTNAVYFFGFWKYEFDKKLTSDADFFAESELAVKLRHRDPKSPKMMVTAESMYKRIKVKMMKSYKAFKYLETENWQAIELPYKGDEISMAVFLPKEKNGLSQLEKNLAENGLSSGLEKLNNAQESKVYVSLPKWKMTWGTKNLCSGTTNVLPELGMKNTFKYAKADFSGIDGTHELYIGEVLHKAFIDVNEEGTEAAAATAVSVKMGCASPPKINKFIADHPFVYVIRDNIAGTILFMGRVVDPTAE